MADDLEAPDETGVLGDEPFEDDGADYDSSPPPRLGGGCFFCNHPKGECMSPGDHCPLAKKMFAPKPVAVSHPVELVESYASTKPADEGGVWVTYKEQDDGAWGCVRVHATEISALRKALLMKHDALFLKWDVLP